MFGPHHLGGIRIDSGALQVEDHIHVFTDHSRDQLQLRNIVDVKGADQRSVAQDRQPVADGEHLVEEVRDEDDAHPLRLQLIHNIKEEFNFVIVKG